MVLKMEAPWLHLSGVKFDDQTARFDLALNVSEVERGIQADLTYNTDLFNADTIVRMLEDFRILLSSIINEPEAKLSALSERINEADRQRWILKQHEFKSARQSRLKDVTPKLVSV